MRDILVVCPQERDLRAIRAAGLEKSYRVNAVGEDLDRVACFDAAGLLEELEGSPADGVIGTKDRAAMLAAIVAERRGLRSPSPGALFACQHKPTSRALQRAVAPEATPDFGLLNGASTPPLRPPFFVKPVIGRLSQNALRIDHVSQLAGLAGNEAYAAGYREIAALAELAPPGLDGFMIEGLLEGLEVTLEGYVHAGRLTIIGVTDSVKYPGTGSFERFEYPSRLSGARRDELAEITALVLPAIGFDWGFFNVEFFVPEDGPAKLIEVNGRIASQFAPLVQAVHGRSTYEALFALACGDDPAWRTGSPSGVAISYVLRTFSDAFVAEVPDVDESTELLVRPGLHLSEQGTNDAESYRLAILYDSGETREAALDRCRARAESLPFRLEPVRSPAYAGSS